MRAHFWAAQVQPITEVLLCLDQTASFRACFALSSKAEKNQGTKKGRGLGLWIEIPREFRSTAQKAESYTFFCGEVYVWELSDCDIWQLPGCDCDVVWIEPVFPIQMSHLRKSRPSQLSRGDLACSYFSPYSFQTPVHGRPSFASRKKRRGVRRWLKPWGLTWGLDKKRGTRGIG